MKRMLVAGACVISAAAFVYSVHSLGLTRIRDTIINIGWGFAAILVLSGLREAARARAWTRTLEGPDRLPLGEALRARLAGEALNTLLPMGFIVGEPAKAEHVGHRLPFSTAFTGLMIELAFYGASLSVIFGAGAASVLPVWMFLPLLAAGTIAFALLANTLFAPIFAFAARDPRRVWEIGILEILYHAFGVVEVYVTLLMIAPSARAWTTAIVFETVNRGVTIVFKMLPMRLGVDEVSAAMAANGLALGSSIGVMLALVRKLRMLFWSAIGLLLLGMRASKQPARPHAIVARQTPRSPVLFREEGTAQPLPSRWA
jgi:hypothetical protein